MVPEPSPPAFQQVTNDRQRAVLQAYAASGQITTACDAAAVHRTTHYFWLRTDPAYAETYAEAHAMVADLLEAEATRRALGWEETAYTSDGTPHTIRKYSDTLLIFRLKAALPDKYRETQRRDARTDVSELLKAVLLELADRSQPRDVTPEADWAPRPPLTRPARPPLPPPPDIDEELPPGR
jgi:hypothetical protein